VAERDGARNVIQRRFDLKAEPTGSREEAAPTPPEVVPRAPPPAPIPRDPSDLELRERQMRWVRERLRHEAAEEPVGGSQGPK
jgi:hypothetical protein